MTDLELIRNEKGLVEGRRWKAVFDGSFNFFTAPTKTEATRIAREYGKRISHKRFLSIEVASPGEEF